MAIALPTMSWEALISQVTPDSTAYQYSCKVTKVNVNDPGYGQLAVGYYIVDYIGHIFEIKSLNFGGDPTGVVVLDLLSDPYSYGPYNDKNAYVYDSLTKAALAAQAKLGRLDQSAEDFVQSLTIEPNNEGFKTYSGHVDNSDSTMSIVTGTFSIEPVSDNYTVYTNGVKHVISTEQTVSITDDQTITYVYIDADGILQKSTSMWNIEGGEAPCAIIFKDGAEYAITDERHGYDRNRPWHKWAHNNIGAMYRSGLTGTFTNTTLSVIQGIIADEDINHDTGGTKTTCSLWYRNATTGMRVVRNSATPYAVNAGTIQYDDGDGTLANVTVGRYVTNWVYATGDTTNPIYVVVGQNNSVSLNDARNALRPTINLSTAEWKLIYSVIYRNAAGTPTYIEAADYRTVQTGVPTTASTQDHSALINRDAANAHPASAVSYDDGTAVLSDVQTEIEDIIDGTTDLTMYVLLAGRNGNILKIDELQEFTLNNGIKLDGLIIKDTGINFEVGATTRIFKDGSNNLSFTDAVLGTKTLTELFSNITAHNLLSTTHGDTLADTVVRGDILVGNSTPKWARLAFPSTPTGKALVATATDVEWSSAAVILEGDSRLTNSRTPTAHNLIDTTGHAVTGLTTGHFLKATGATTYGFAAHGLTYSDVGAAPLSHAHGNITTDGKIGSTAGLMVKTTTDGVLTTLAAGSLGQYLKYDGTWDTPVGGAPAYGTDNQIPVMNAGGIAFEYNTYFKYDVTKGLILGDVRSSIYYGNVIIGNECCNAGITSAYNNVIVGYQSAYGLTAGDHNVILGKTNGSAMADSNYNVIIGSGAGNTIANKDNNIMIGYYAGRYETDNNSLYIDSLDRTDLATGKINSLIYGTFNATPASQLIRFNSQVQFPLITGSGTGTSMLYFNRGTGAITYGDAPAGSASQWTTTGSDIYYTTGNVGIGTTAPTEKLQVDGNVFLNASNPVIVIRNTGSSTEATSRINFQTSQGTLRWQIGIGQTVGNVFEINEGTTNRLNIAAGGNVGIGNVSPAYKLDVTGTGRFTSTVTIGAYTLPSTDGAASQVLKTDGSGTVSWATPSTEAFAALSSSASVSWDCSTGLNKTLTRGGNFTLTLTNFANGMVGTVRLDITSTTTITLSASGVTFKGSGSISSLATGIYYLSWICTSTSAIEYNIVKYV